MIDLERFVISEGFNGDLEISMQFAIFAQRKPV
jgi:hypothetical protein